MFAYQTLGNLVLTRWRETERKQADDFSYADSKRAVEYLRLTMMVTNRGVNLLK